MSLLSYAQHGEDIVLYRALSHVDRGFYIDIGACDPEEMSVTKLFYDRGWSGINIEPIRAYHDRFVAARPRDINLNVAAAAHSGLLPFHHVVGTGLSTLVEEAARTAVGRGFTSERIDVPALSLVDLLRSHPVDAVHFLKVDVEGAERAVLEGADFTTFRPWIIVVEATKPNSAERNDHLWRDILEANGYDATLFDGLNLFFLAKERQQLRASLEAPANVHDAFVTAPHHRAVARAAALEEGVRQRVDELGRAERLLAEAGAAGRRAAEERDAAVAGIAARDRDLARLGEDVAAATEAAREAERAATDARRNFERLRIERAALMARSRRAQESAAAALAAAAAADREGHERLAEVESLRDADRAALDRVTHERDVILASTSWRAARAVQRLIGGVPSPARRNLRRAVKLLYLANKPRRLVEVAKRNLVRDASLDASRETPLLAYAPGAAPVPGGPASARDAAYRTWIETVEAVLPPARPIEAADASRRTVAFLLPDGRDGGAVLATIASLDDQGHAAWRAVVAAAGAGADLSAALRARGLDDRVRVVDCGTDPDRGAVLAALLAATSDDWFSVLDAGDALAPGALDRLDLALAEDPGALLVHSDEDERTPDGERSSPLFKPEHSPELLQSYDYFGRSTFVSRRAAEKVGGFRPGQGAGAEWSLHLRLSDAALGGEGTIGRLPFVLCHRAPGRSHGRPRPRTVAASQFRAVLSDHWRARGIAAPDVTTQPDGTHRSTWPLAHKPLVSVIIPSHDKPELLKVCLDGLLEETDYDAIEIVVVENNSKDPATWRLYAELERRPNARVIRADGPFNYSAACNRGAAVARGDLLLFLNNDVEVVDPGWLGELVRVAGLPGVGVVGAKLNYPDGTLQHAGVAVGIHLFALMFNNAAEDEWGVFGSPGHVRNWLAIMGACQMVRRTVFDLVGGFDESFRIANSDVALSLRAHRAGWRVAYTPFAPLIHHEGKTRGHTNPAEDMARSAREVRALGIDVDPYLHPQLSALSPVPLLRLAGEPDLAANLQRLADSCIAAGPQRPEPLNLSDDHDAEEASGLPARHLLWPPLSAGDVRDAVSAARFVIDLLRRRPDLRLRFPRALSDGVDGAFCRWLQGEGRVHCGLTDVAVREITAPFAADIGAPVGQFFFWHDHLRKAFPLATLPAGRRAWFAWLMTHGRMDEGLGTEAIWWAMLASAEDPARELVRLYAFTPAWQELHPYGLTVFGREAFSAWMAGTYGIAIETPWLAPETWPVALSPADQVRLTYQNREGWRSAHPDAFADRERMRAFVSWLKEPGSGLPEHVRRWCAASLDAAAVDDLAEGRGVNVIAHFCYPSGLRVSAEAMTDAIAGAGYQVLRRDIRTDLSDDPFHTDHGGLEIHDVTIIHAQPEPFFDDVYRQADLAPRHRRTYRIAYWYWELDVIPDSWLEAASTVDEVWAATDFVADALRSALDKPVHTLFPGVRIGSYTPRPRRSFGLPGREEGRFAFLFSFHMGSITERKNPEALIRAFKMAFDPGEAVDLILKTTTFGRHDEQLRDLVEQAAGANIHVIDRVLPPDEILSLMEACDCYVSLHRSEGLGLTMAEAMLLGKPVIATRYSGNLDFMDDTNSVLVDCTVEPIGRDIPPYTVPNARWAEPDVAQAARAMRRMVDDEAFRAAIARKGREDAGRTLSLEAAGRRFSARLSAIRGMIKER